MGRRRVRTAIDKELVDQLLSSYKKSEDTIGESRLLKKLTKAILERALSTQMTDHLDSERHAPAGQHWETRATEMPRNLERRCRLAGAGDFARLRGDDRSQDHGTDAPYGLRRKDHLDVVLLLFWTDICCARIALIA